MKLLPVQKISVSFHTHVSWRSLIDLNMNIL